MVVSMNYKKIDNIIYLLFGIYFLLPIFLLLIFWFKIYISLPIICMIIFIFYKFYTNKSILSDSDYAKIYNIKKWIMLIILIVLLCFFSGAGGFKYQNWDYNARNAVLNDLVNYDWPVKYNYKTSDAEKLGFNKGILSYYFTYWLPAAMVGKIFGIEVAHKFLFFWQILGLFIFFVFLSRYLKKSNIFYFFIFFAFSGVDIIGNIIFDILNNVDFSMTSLIGIEHIDTFGDYFCFSSFITQVFWVFNQSIPAFIITTLLLNEKNLKNIGIFMLLLIPFSPFPSLGLLYIISIFTLFGYECKEKFQLKRIKKLLTIQNILCFVCVIPIIGLFFLNASSHSSGLILSKTAVKNEETITFIIKYLVLMILEVYLYVALISNERNKKFLLLVSLYLSIIPFYYVGIGLDFCNRVCIPGLMIIFIYVVKYFNNLKINRINYKTIILIIVLLLSSITGINEVRRSYLFSIQNKEMGKSNITDNWETYGTIKNNEVAGFILNFVSKYDDKIFFKYFIR